jgi:hypothetical protein
MDKALTDIRNWKVERQRLAEEQAMELDTNSAPRSYEYNLETDEQVPESDLLEDDNIETVLSLVRRSDSGMRSTEEIDSKVTGGI